jgi:hypothetical protein
MGPTPSPVQWIPRTLSLGVKQPGLETDYSAPPRAEVKNTQIYASIRLHAVVFTQAHEQLLSLELLSRFVLPLIENVGAMKESWTTCRGP